MLNYRIDIEMNGSSVLRDANISDAAYFTKGLMTRRTTKPGDVIQLKIKEDPKRKQEKNEKKKLKKQQKAEEIQAAETPAVEVSADVDTAGDVAVVTTDTVVSDGSHVDGV